MLSEHPLFRRFERRVTLWDKELECETEGRDLYLRPVGKPVDVVWCRPCHRLPWIQHRLQPQRSQFNPNLKYWKDHFPYRFCPINRTTELFLREGHGFYRSSVFPYLLRFSLPHHFFGRCDPLTMDAPEMRRLVADWKEEEEFACLEKLAQNGCSASTWWECQRGSWEELEPLLKALFILVEGRFYFAPGLSAKELAFKSSLEFSCPKDKGKLKFAAVLARFFEVRVSHDMKRLYTEPERPSNAPVLEMKSPSSQDISQHERLEARLLWRDFLRDKLAPADIEHLLRE